MVTVSTDLPEEILDKRKQTGLQDIMLSDRDLAVADAFGLRNQGPHSGPPSGAEALPVPTALLIDREAEALSAQVGNPRGRRRFQPVRLAGDLSYDQRARVECHLYALPGVVSDVRPRRHYVGGELAAHLLGYLGEIQREQLETRRFADYRQGEVIGQAGIESVLQVELRGRAGCRNLVVDVAGRVMDVLAEIEPLPGGRVTLTLDNVAGDAVVIHVDPADSIPEICEDNNRATASSASK